VRVWIAQGGPRHPDDAHRHDNEDDQVEHNSTSQMERCPS
jgi:hypothetical protein